MEAGSNSFRRGSIDLSLDIIKEYVDNQYCKKERRELQSRMFESQKNKASSSNLASVAEGTENVLSESTSLVSDAWIDFGCSYYICLNQEWFAIYMAVDGTK